LAPHRRASALAGPGWRRASALAGPGCDSAEATGTGACNAVWASPIRPGDTTLRVFPGTAVSVYRGRGGTRIPMTPISVPAADLDRMMRIVEALDLGEDGGGLPWSILHELRGLVRCEVIEFGSFDYAQRLYYYDQGLDRPAYDPATDDIFWELFPTSCGYQDPATEFRKVRQSTDPLNVRAVTPHADVQRVLSP
jgi:hypothetical protein